MKQNKTIPTTINDLPAAPLYFKYAGDLPALLLFIPVYVTSESRILYAKYTFAKSSNMYYTKTLCFT